MAQRDKTARADLANAQARMQRELERVRQGLFQGLAVFPELLGVSVLQLLDLHLVLLLGLLEFDVVVLVELLVLLNVRLLDLLLALLVREDQLLVLHIEFLLLEFLDAVLGQLSLCTNRRKRSQRKSIYLTLFPWWKKMADLCSTYQRSALPPRR